MLVIDASVALAWALPDEQDAFATSVLELVASEGALVPSIWALEVGNALFMAERRKRLTAAQFKKSLSLLRELRIRVSSPAIEADLGQVLVLAQTHKLTSYDAAYLELAIRASCPLATLDAGLGKAAKVLGVAFKVP
jgi:predicted nucleic acid-binding protein